MPRLALASASDGEHTCIILPADVGAFITRHQAAHVVMHNAAFDYHVIRQHLRGARRAAHLGPAWLMLGSSTASLLLAMLVDIGTIDDTNRFNYGLDNLALRYLELQVDKSNEYRLRFGELLGHDWSTPVDPGFLSYAAADPFITLMLWQELKRRRWTSSTATASPSTWCSSTGCSPRCCRHAPVSRWRTSTTEVCTLTAPRWQRCAPGWSSWLEQVAQLQELAPDVFSRKRSGELRYPNPGQHHPEQGTAAPEAAPAAVC